LSTFISIFSFLLQLGQYLVQLFWEA